MTDERPGGNPPTYCAPMCETECPPHSDQGCVTNYRIVAEPLWSAIDRAHENTIYAVSTHPDGGAYLRYGWHQATADWIPDDLALPADLFVSHRLDAAAVYVTAHGFGTGGDYEPAPPDALGFWSPARVVVAYLCAWTAHCVRRLIWRYPDYDRMRMAAHWNPERVYAIDTHYHRAVAAAGWSFPNEHDTGERTGRWSRAAEGRMTDIRKRISQAAGHSAEPPAEHITDYPDDHPWNHGVSFPAPWNRRAGDTAEGG